MELRFGTSIIPTVGGRTDPVEDAIDAERLGFDFVTCWDHLHGDTPSYETWTLLTWIAARTERIRIATNVLGLPYRHPTVTSKMAETLQRLSGGRFILGLGGGGSDVEFSSWGLDVRSAREKVDALEEAIRVVRGMWSEREFTFEGDHYRTHAAWMEPKPDTPIPIWLGVYGKRALTLVGRLADGWIPSMGFAPPERVTSLRDRVRRSAGAAGRDPDTLTYAYNIPVLVQEDARDPQGRTLAGSPQEIAGKLANFAELGFNVLNLWPRGDRASGRERLASEVVPAVREMVS
ncbi:MAG TPA: LLM class flavin-dependent oxidoreductase [Actinomycetota bacterium]|nr:LLM class flavin-dependent oxidoreductase [Actinomycetota bacterium]